MRTALLIAALILTGAAEANCNLSSVRLSAGLVKVGDSERRIVQSGPDRSVRLETRKGGAAGYRHEFYRRDVTIQVYVRSGQVVRICRIRD